MKNGTKMENILNAMKHCIVCGGDLEKLTPMKVFCPEGHGHLEVTEISADGAVGFEGRMWNWQGA